MSAQPGTAVTNFFAQTPAPLPDYLTEAFGDDVNILARVTVPSLTYRGKVWRQVLEGDEVALTKKNEDGESVPVAQINVVVIEQSHKRSRRFYEGEYEEGKNKAPRCASVDGVVPDADIENPCATSCAVCPNSAKGSSRSGKGAACSAFKNVAVINAGLKGKLLRLSMAQTSIWDKDNPTEEAKGWFAYDQYIEQLRSRGCPNTAAVVTKIKFDPETAYPKLLFSAMRWLTPEEIKVVAALRKDPEIPDLIGGTAKAALAAPQPRIAAIDDEQRPATPTPAVAAPAPAPKPVVVPKPAPVKAVKAAPPVPVQPPPEQTPVAEVATAGGGLDDLLAEWDT
jgi:hypothetical protein